MTGEQVERMVEEFRAYEDRELWEFLRHVERSTWARGWHPQSPVAIRLRTLQDRYDPSGASPVREVSR